MEYPAGSKRRGTPKVRISQVEPAAVPVGKRFVNGWCVVGAAEQPYFGFSG